MSLPEGVRMDGVVRHRRGGSIAKVVIKIAYAVAATIAILLFFGLVVGVPN